MYSASDLCLKLDTTVCLTDNPGSFIFGVALSLALAALLVFLVRKLFWAFLYLVQGIGVVFSALLETRRNKKARKHQRKVFEELVAMEYQRIVSERSKRPKREQ